MKSTALILARVSLALCLTITAGQAAAFDNIDRAPLKTEEADTSLAVEAKQFDLPAELQGLSFEPPQAGTYIAVDVSKNTAYLFRDGQLVERSRVATGSDKMLKKGRKTWLFRTPRGRHKVIRKIVDPVWRKPDWAFVEAGQAIPPADSPKRLEKGTLGKFALDLGDGILIHGTRDVNSFGRKASHGCIRMPDEMLELVYREASVGTEVYIFDSEPAVRVADGEGLNDLNYKVR